MGHVLTIESDEAFALASRLAEMKGVSFDEAVLVALRQQVEAEQSLRDHIAAVNALTAEFRATLTSMPSSSDHNWLYDDKTGLPI